MIHSDLIRRHYRFVVASCPCHGDGVLAIFRYLVNPPSCSDFQCLIALPHRECIRICTQTAVDRILLNRQALESPRLPFL